ncbi:MAG: hypothetical protein H7287_01035 [Thermoleophilia bacterium]|nr:hypothetical protein [Thermoleophilia bacterium]
MPSHVYFFNRNAVPDWNARDYETRRPAAIESRRRAVGAVRRAIPDVTEEVLVNDPSDVVILDASGLEIGVYEGFVHVRIPYWSSGELRRMAVPERLEALAESLRTGCGYDFVEHGDLGLGVEADVAGIVDRIDVAGQRMVELLRAAAPDEPPMRGSELAW